MSDVYSSFFDPLPTETFDAGFDEFDLGRATQLQPVYQNQGELSYTPGECYVIAEPFAANTSAKSEKSTNSKGTKKRRRPYYVPVNGLVRIVKRDIRRDYATMLVNVYNSGDDAMVERFLRQICIPNCQTVRFSFLSSKFNRPSRKYSDGVKTMIAQMKELFDSFSDFTVRLENAKIYRRSDLVGSKVILETEIQFSELFTNEFTLPCASTNSLSSLSSSSSSSSTFSSMQHLEKHDEMLHYYYDHNPYTNNTTNNTSNNRQLPYHISSSAASTSSYGSNPNEKQEEENYGLYLVPWIASLSLGNTNSNTSNTSNSSSSSSSSNSSDGTSGTGPDSVANDILQDITTMKSQRMVLQPCVICQSSRKKLLHSPVPIYSKVTITMCLDEDHQMYRLEVIPTCTTVKKTPSSASSASSGLGPDCYH